MSCTGGSSAEVKLVLESRRKRKDGLGGSSRRCAIVASRRGSLANGKANFSETKRCPGDTTVILNNATVHVTGGN